MENANHYEYLEKIKIAVIENLRKTVPVPSVQMQDVPRQGLGLSDDQEDEMDDLDDDENKDVRMTQRQHDKHIVNREEFEESDDEDLAAANGVWKVKKGNARLNIMDFPNPHAVADDEMEVDSGVATPAAKDGDVATDNDETMLEEPDADVTVEAIEAPTEAKPETDTAATAVSPPEAEPAQEPVKVDGDGDVDMAEAEDKPVEATIKTEEVDQNPGDVERRKTPVEEADQQTPKSPTGDVAPSTEETNPTHVPEQTDAVASGEQEEDKAS